MINKRVQCNSILMAGKADCGSSFGRFMQRVIGNMKTTIKPPTSDIRLFNRPQKKKENNMEQVV
jgi:hypothetical protein